MRSLNPTTVNRWSAQLAERGYTPTRSAAGVEGAVFRLGNGSVAKVWNSRTEVEIDRLASFYGAVSRAGLPFLTPEIQHVGHFSDATFSIERELPGCLLFPLHDTGQSPPQDPRRLQCVAEVLTALAAVRPSDEMKLLPILDEPDPLWREGSFNGALGQLVTRRVERSLKPVSVAIPAIGELAATLAARLPAMDAGPDGLIHGDLIPANILVDEEGNVAAVLDFGFFSTVGAPAFDAAVAADIFRHVRAGQKRELRCHGEADPRHLRLSAGGAGRLPRRVCDGDDDDVRVVRRGRPLPLVRRGAATPGRAGRTLTACPGRTMRHTRNSQEV